MTDYHKRLLRRQPAGHPARKNAKDFPEGTRVVMLASGWVAEVVRFVPGSNQLGGHFSLRWLPEGDTPPERVGEVARAVYVSNFRKADS